MRYLKEITGNGVHIWAEDSYSACCSASFAVTGYPTMIESKFPFETHNRYRRRKLLLLPRKAK